MLTAPRKGRWAQCQVHWRWQEGPLERALPGGGAGPGPAALCHMACRLAGPRLLPPMTSCVSGRGLLFCDGLENLTALNTEAEGWLTTVISNHSVLATPFLYCPDPREKRLPEASSLDPHPGPAPRDQGAVGSHSIPAVSGGCFTDRVRDSKKGCFIRRLSRGSASFLDQKIRGDRSASRECAWVCWTSGRNGDKRTLRAAMSTLQAATTRSQLGRDASAGARLSPTARTHLETAAPARSSQDL